MHDDQLDIKVETIPSLLSTVPNAAKNSRSKNNLIMILKNCQKEMTGQLETVSVYEETFTL